MKMIILDVDNTFVHSTDPSFYSSYSTYIEQALSLDLNVGSKTAKEIATTYREKYGGAELAFFRNDLGDHFPALRDQTLDPKTLYKSMASIVVGDHFYCLDSTKDIFKRLRAAKLKLVALTDSPEEVSRKVLSRVQIEPEESFDLYVPYTLESGPRKSTTGSHVFAEIASKFSVPHEQVLCVGDSLHNDIIPAKAIGMKTCLVSSPPKENYQGTQISEFRNLLEIKELEIVL